MESPENTLPWPVVMTALIQSVIFAVLVLGWNWTGWDALIILSLGDVFMIGIVVAVLHGGAQSEERCLMCQSLMDTIKRDRACMVGFLWGRR